MSANRNRSQRVADAGIVMVAAETNLDPIKTVVGAKVRYQMLRLRGEAVKIIKIRSWERKLQENVLAGIINVAILTFVLYLFIITWFS